MKKIASILIATYFFLGNINSQTITPLLDPNGDPVIIPREEGYVFQLFNDLAIYTLNHKTGLMNVMTTDGDSAIWLLENEEELPQESLFSGLFRINGYGFGFEVDSMWFVSNWSVGGTRLIYNEKGEQSKYTFSELFRIRDFGDPYFTAIGNYKESGRAVLLILYDQSMGFEPLNTLDEVQAFKLVRQIGGQDAIMTVKEWKPLVEEWENLQMKYWHFAGFYKNLDVPGDEEATSIEYRDLAYSDQNVLVFIEDSVLLYGNNELNTLYTNITDELKGEGELKNIQITFDTYGRGDSRLVLIERLMSDGSTRYYYDIANDPSHNIIEFTPIRNGDVDEIYIHGTATTLSFFYNHADTSHGFSTYEIKNNKLIKDVISKPLPRDFKIGAYDGFLVYYAYQSPIDGEFYMSYFDMWQAVRQNYVQSADGKRIKNPRQFWFMDEGFETNEFICIESVVEDSVHMMVFDEDGIISATEHISEINFDVNVFPNPSNDIVNIECTIDRPEGDYTYSISDTKGAIVGLGIIDMLGSNQVNVKQFISGAYTLSILKQGQLLYSTTLHIIH